MMDCEPMRDSLSRLVFKNGRVVIGDQQTTPLYTNIEWDKEVKAYKVVLELYVDNIEHARQV